MRNFQQKKANYIRENKKFVCHFPIIIGKARIKW